MDTICGMDCCAQCPRLAECGGCRKAGGHPFGGNCTAAEQIGRGGQPGFQQFKKDLIAEINTLGIPGLTVSDLNLLNGFFVNLEYPLPGGQTAKFLKDNDVYLGNQIEVPGCERCYGVVGGEDFLLVCQYGCCGKDPEIILYKKRLPAKAAGAAEGGPR